MSAGRRRRIPGNAEIVSCELPESRTKTASTYYLCPTPGAAALHCIARAQQSCFQATSARSCERLLLLIESAVAERAPTAGTHTLSSATGTRTAQLTAAMRLCVCNALSAAACSARLGSRIATTCRFSLQRTTTSFQLSLTVANLGLSTEFNTLNSPIMAHLS